MFKVEDNRRPPELPYARMTPEGNITLYYEDGDMIGRLMIGEGRVVSIPSVEVDYYIDDPIVKVTLVIE